VERFPDLVPLALSLGIGLLVSLERGWSARDAEAGTRVAGFRTFGFLGLLGGLAALAPIPIAAVMLGAGAALVIAGYARRAGRAVGMTAGMITREIVRD
jgi:hypothetical protein